MSDTSVDMDLDQMDVRAVNRILQGRAASPPQVSALMNPKGRHAVAAGLMHPVCVNINGHVGYYCAGMNQNAQVEIHGNAGVGVAENMMSGTVHVHGDASQSAGATGHGGLLIIDGNASARCGISMKGITIVVKGSVGHNSAFMAQAGTLVICGDADDGLGDSIYEAVIYLRGSAQGLGADCIEYPMDEDDRSNLAGLLAAAGVEAELSTFRRYGSARALYNFKIDNLSAY